MKKGENSSKFNLWRASTGRTPSHTVTLSIFFVGPLILQMIKEKLFALVMQPILSSAFGSWSISFPVWKDLPEAFLHPTLGPIVGFSVHSWHLVKNIQPFWLLGISKLFISFLGRYVRRHFGARCKVLWLWELATRLEWPNCACFWYEFTGIQSWQEPS